MAQTIELAFNQAANQQYPSPEVVRTAAKQLRAPGGTGR